MDWGKILKLSKSVVTSLDRNARVRFRYLLDTHYRAHRLVAKQERIGVALLKRSGGRSLILSLS